MQKTFMTLVLGAALAGVAVGPTIAAQSHAEQADMQKQQVERAKKALDNALVALQASGDWHAGGNKEAAMRGVESAITEVQKEMAHPR